MGSIQIFVQCDTSNLEAKAGTLMARNGVDQGQQDVVGGVRPRMAWLFE